MKENIWKPCNFGLETAHRNNFVGLVRALMSFEVLCYHSAFKRKSIALHLILGAVAWTWVLTAFTNQFLSWMVEGFVHLKLHLCFRTALVSCWLFTCFVWHWPCCSRYSHLRQPISQMNRTLLWPTFQQSWDSWGDVGEGTVGMKEVENKTVLGYRL